MSEATIPAVSGLPGRLARLYGGLALYGTGIGLQVESGLGNGPWDVFHQGVGLRAGLSIGTVIIVVGALVMLAWIPLRQRPGFGTVSNVIFVGLFADAAIHLLPPAGHPMLALALRGARRDVDRAGHRPLHQRRPGRGTPRRDHDRPGPDWACPYG